MENKIDIGQANASRREAQRARREAIASAPRTEFTEMLARIARAEGELLVDDATEQSSRELSAIMRKLQDIVIGEAKADRALVREAEAAIKRADAANAPLVASWKDEQARREAWAREMKAKLKAARGAR